MAAAIARAYVGLNAAALCTAVEFGAQYHLFQAADGTPLFMYPMKMAVAAMMIEHLVLAGPSRGDYYCPGIGICGQNHPTLMSDKVPVNGKPGHSEG